VWTSKVTMGWRPSTFDIRTEELRDLVRRSREVVLLAAITGAVTGLFVRFFEYVVVEVLFERIVHGPLWVAQWRLASVSSCRRSCCGRSATVRRRRRPTSI
jgi:hypothetical protein